MGYFVQKTISLILSMGTFKPFVSLTADELVFGYDDQLVSLAHRFYPKRKRPSEKMGLFITVSSVPWYSINYRLAWNVNTNIVQRQLSTIQNFFFQSCIKSVLFPFSHVTKVKLFHWCKKWLIRIFRNILISPILNLSVWPYGLSESQEKKSIRRIILVKYSSVNF